MKDPFLFYMEASGPEDVHCSALVLAFDIPTALVYFINRCKVSGHETATVRYRPLQEIEDAPGLLAWHADFHEVGERA